jgi:hypothetical protein
MKTLKIMRAHSQVGNTTIRSPIPFRKIAKMENFLQNCWTSEKSKNSDLRFIKDVKTFSLYLPISERTTEYHFLSLLSIGFQRK